MRPNGASETPFTSVSETAPKAQETGANMAESLQSAERGAIGPLEPVITVAEFHLASMLFVTISDFSTSQYQALVEVLALATPENLQLLSKSIKTLGKNC